MTTARLGGLIIDFFKTLGYGPSLVEACPALCRLDGADRRRLRDAWMRGKIGADDIAREAGSHISDEQIAGQLAAASAKPSAITNLRALLSMLPRTP